VGGFYGDEIAMAQAREIVMNGQGDYLVVSGELGSLVGYRVESRSRALIEIDLTWGYMYPALAKLVIRDMELRRKTA
jgi:hypothetical protein